MKLDDFSDFYKVPFHYVHEVIELTKDRDKYLFVPYQMKDEFDKKGYGYAIQT